MPEASPFPSDQSPTIESMAKSCAIYAGQQGATPWRNRSARTDDDVVQRDKEPTAKTDRCDNGLAPRTSLGEYARAKS